jgi:hypothetical protein
VPARQKKESTRSLDAFEQYYQLGDQRSLSRLAEITSIPRNTLERWSVSFDWQARILARKNEEIAAARAAARKEAATLARRRLRNAHLLQEAGLALISKANITGIEAEDARKALQTALSMITEGMKYERLETGEATDAVRLVPPKPIEAMTDDELAAFLQEIDAAEG